MQSFLQYRRFGKAVEAQLERDRDRLTEVRQQRCYGNPTSQSSASSINPQDDLDDPTGLAELRGLQDLRTISTQATTGTTLGLTLTGIEVRDRTTKEGGPIAGKVFVVSFENEHDPMDPHNWSFAARMSATLALSLIAAIVGFAPAIDASIISQASREFGVSDVAESLVTGIFLIGFGFGAWISGPFSETVGRNPIYIITMALYMLFLVGAGLARNLGGQLATRFFAGLFAATPLVCSGGSISDLWTPAERVFAFPIFATMGFLGPELGPIVGGWVAQAGISWRWTEWISLIASGIILTIVVLFQPETYSPILLKWKAKHLRRITGDDRYWGGIEIRRTHLVVRLMQALYRPVLITAQEPIIILLALYLTVVYIILFTFLTGYSYIYTDTYGLSPGITGTCFLGLAIGILLCPTLIPVNIHLRKRDIARARAIGPDAKVAPESRLYWAMIGAPAIPISMFWMAWTIRPDISLWSPLIASVMTGFGILCIFMTCTQYVIDSYEIYAASALSSITVIRYVVAGAMIEVSIPFYKNMGIAHTLTILASLSALLVPIPYVFYKYGPWIRSKSKYAFDD